jgi:hypothetical protein
MDLDSSTQKATKELMQKRLSKKETKHMSMKSMYAAVKDVEDRRTSMERSLDAKLLRKLDSNHRTFVSQIDSIPGPK